MYLPDGELLSTESEVSEGTPDPSDEGVTGVTGLSVRDTQQGARRSHVGVFTSASLSGQLPPPEPLITQAGLFKLFFPTLRRILSSAASEGDLRKQLPLSPLIF